MKRLIEAEINVLLLTQLDEYCRIKGLSRDFVLAVAIDQFLDSERANARHS